MKKQIHLFFFIHDLAPFGAQRVILEIVKNIDKEIFKVTVCSFSGEETLAEEFSKYGAEIVLLKAKRFLDVFAWIKLFRLLFVKRPDIIQTNLAELSIPVRFISMFIPKLHLAHVFQNPPSSEPLYWRFLNKITLNMCDSIISSSKGIYDEVANISIFAKKKIVSISNCVQIKEAEEEKVEELKRELTINDGEKIIGCVGRLTGQKGQDILIEAVALMKGKISFKLLLVGDGETLQELKSKVEFLEIGDSVLFLERRNDIAEILSLLDIYVAPSRWESFNIALGEAMSLEIPCIATDITGHKDLLVNDVTGILVPTENKASIFEAINWILNNSQDAEKIAVQARDRVRSEFTAEKMVVKYENIYKALRLN